MWIKKNKDFDAKVYKQRDRVVIAFAESNVFKQNDLRNDNAVINGKIPSQYGDAERLYNLVKSKYGNCKIEFYRSTSERLLLLNLNINKNLIMRIWFLYK